MKQEGIIKDMAINWHEKSSEQDDEDAKKKALRN